MNSGTPGELGQNSSDRIRVAMREISALELEPGMIVGRTIRQEDNRILLARGVPLNDRIIRKIRARGLSSVWVTAIAAASASPIDQQVREVTTKHLDRFVEITKLPGAQTPEGDVDHLLSRLRDDVEAILCEITAGPLAERFGSSTKHHKATFDHSIDVAVVSAIIARKLYLGIEETRSLTLGALLHDIGKTAVPADLLAKGINLTEDEWAQLRRHPETGASILRSWSLDDPIPEIVALQHHESQNGLGFPLGRHGTNRVFREANANIDPTRIHLSAEIVAVADHYVNLTTEVPGSPALEIAAAVRSMRELAGAILNRQMVEALLSVVPSLPLGTPVRLLGGRYPGYQGVVIRIDDARPSRPVVRLLTNEWGEQVRPIEVDLAAEYWVEVRPLFGASIDELLANSDVA